jgi:hypothetical protein
LALQDWNPLELIFASTDHAGGEEVSGNDWRSV